MDAVSHDFTNVDAVTVIDKLLTVCASCLEKLDCKWTGLTLLYMPSHTSEPDLHKGKSLKIFETNFKVQIFLGICHLAYYVTFMFFRLP